MNLEKEIEGEGHQPAGTWAMNLEEVEPANLPGSKNQPQRTCTLKAPVRERDGSRIRQAVKKCRLWWGWGQWTLPIFTDTLCAGWGREHRQGAWRVTEQSLGDSGSLEQVTRQEWAQLCFMYLLPFQPASIYDLVPLYPRLGILGFREVKHILTSTLHPREGRSKRERRRRREHGVRGQTDLSSNPDFTWVTLGTSLYQGVFILPT